MMSIDALHVRLTRTTMGWLQVDFEVNKPMAKTLGVKVGGRTLRGCLLPVEDWRGAREEGGAATERTVGGC